MRRSGLVLVLALLVALSGCARGDRGQTPPGGAAGPEAGGTQAGLTGAGLTGGGPQGGPGAREDLGQQISDLIAAIDGIEALSVGGSIEGEAGPGGPVGVSTLVLGDEAFVAIDPASLGGGGKSGDLTGGTMGGIPGVDTGVGRPATPGAIPPSGGLVPWGTAPRTAEFDQMIRSYVTVVFPQIRDVHVTTDRDLVHRITRLARAQQAGGLTAADMAEARAIADSLRGAGAGSP